MGDTGPRRVSTEQVARRLARALDEVLMDAQETAMRDARTIVRHEPPDGVPEGAIRHSRMLTRPEIVDLCRRAYSLRVAGLPYASIATVMRHDHGFDLSPSSWRHRCRLMQVAPDLRCANGFCGSPARGA